MNPSPDLRNKAKQGPCVGRFMVDEALGSIVINHMHEVKLGFLGPGDQYGASEGAV